MASHTPRLVVFLASAALLATVPAAAQNNGFGGLAEKDVVKPPPPGEGGDAELPAGYKNVRWGINDIAMQHVLGRPLEMAPGMDSHRHWLIDTPPTNDALSDRGVVKFHFWDSQLFEVKMYYNLTARDGKELLARFEERYGTAKHDVEKDGELRYGERERGVSSETWLWQDPFTVQILRRDLKGEKWSMVRQSRVLEEKRLAQQRKERESKRDSKIDSIDLD